MLKLKVIPPGDIMPTFEKELHFRKLDFHDHFALLEAIVAAGDGAGEVPMLEFIRLKIGTMAVSENGIVEGRPLNPRASELYNADYRGGEIFGTAILFDGQLMEIMD